MKAITSGKSADPFPGIIPNLCGLMEVFVLMVSVQLLAMLFTLVANKNTALFWTDLGFMSLELQWMALLGAAVLCPTRRILNRLSAARATLFSYLILMLVVMAVSETTYQVNQYLNAYRIDHGQFLLRHFLVAAVLIAVLLRYLYVSFQWRKNVEAESQARVKMLQARIRPHFLFNCMNTIASLTRTDPEKAERVVLNLSDLFRYSLSEGNKRVNLSDELELIQQFLDIEKQRLASRLNVEWHNDVPDNALIPPLTLQPLVENAVYHGIEACVEGGLLNIDLQLRDGKISAHIRNPKPPQPPLSQRRGNGIAQKNIKERLQLWYGSAAKFNVEQNDRQYTVHLELPYETADP